MEHPRQALLLRTEAYLVMAGARMSEFSDGRKIALNFGVLGVLLASIAFWAIVGTLILKWLAPS